MRNFSSLLYAFVRSTLLLNFNGLGNHRLHDVLCQAGFYFLQKQQAKTSVSVCLGIFIAFFQQLYLVKIVRKVHPTGDYVLRIRMQQIPFMCMSPLSGPD